MNNQRKSYYVIELLHHPDDYWHKLLDYVSQTANLVEFAVSGKERMLPTQLKPFSASLIAKFSSQWKWFAKQWGSTTFFQFSLSKELYTYIRTLPKLDDWTGNYPEDPTFYSENQPMLWTMSHDGLAFILLSTDEANQFREQGFDLKIIQPPNEYLHGSASKDFPPL